MIEACTQWLKLVHNDWSLYTKNDFFIVIQNENKSRDEFSHLMWETQKFRVIKAGSLEKLVEYLYIKVSVNQWDSLEPDYINSEKCTDHVHLTVRAVFSTF